MIGLFALLIMNFLVMLSLFNATFANISIISIFLIENKAFIAM